MTLDILTGQLRRIVDTPTEEIEGYAPGAAVVTVTNGAETVTATPDSGGHFTASVPIGYGANTLTVTATGTEGDTAAQTITAHRLISNRTESDVARLQALRVKGWEAMSAAERAEYEATGQRGGYNNTDMNRVTAAAAFLDELLRADGYTISFSGVNFEDGEIPAATKRAQYLANISAARVLPTQYAPPESLEYVGVDDANDIEKTLVDLDRLRKSASAAQLYTDEPFCGEF